MKTRRVSFTIFCLCCGHLSLLCEALSLSLNHLVEKHDQRFSCFNNGTLYSLSFGDPAAMAASISSKQRSHLPRRCRQADLKSFGIRIVLVVMVVMMVLVLMVVMITILLQSDITIHNAVSC